MNARSALFDLYGDHLRTRKGEAAVSALVRLLAPLDIKAPAVRTAVSRIETARKGCYRGFCGPSRTRHIGMKARVTVTLKTGILDPQGKAIEGALKSLGVEGVASVRQGKVFDIELAATDKAKAEAALKAAADKLLANTVVENYRVDVVG